ncbi:NAD(P)H-dependent glycerol-3-phosphate dehydrogenase [Roseovarius rhodophyticola]|uniref:Glycerol-3-phosphate dehydrogenase [NAD(P)+] n=1 Tax=Roseovarius rhodophyticola TaxID=3080827 RepID=A0ABZ2TIY1_9RHOB|nr:NAD(P)H-dependent glycerol-3-phosphate dehydrogenase [Roseovarius sp. W115]MDV2930014.1 NAD(P)H-dependent glycerol-3-phosphate dehydrogenase [Roseovarius sp. W115]
MIHVMGAGAYGTALAVSLAQNGPVTLWLRDKVQAKEIQETRENRKRLPGVRLPDNLTVTSAMPAPKDGELTLLAVPTQKLRGFLESHVAQLGRGPLIACCKGMELGTGLSPTKVISALRPQGISAILTGPSFAADVARGLPTALTFACADAESGTGIQAQLTTPNIRVYRTTDVIGAEFGGALKNVMAIGCGAVIGAGLGESARSALMTRGFAEIVRVATTHGAQRDTLSGLSGFGDLVLTCTSEQSRNYMYGQSIGRGDVFDETVTVEGAATARAMTQLAQDQGLDLPVTTAVCGLVQGKLKVRDAMDMLLSRPLKEE